MQCNGPIVIIVGASDADLPTFDESVASASAPSGQQQQFGKVTMVRSDETSPKQLDTDGSSAVSNRL